MQLPVEQAICRQIVELLKEGKTKEEIVAMGFNKNTVSAQATKLHYANRPNPNQLEFDFVSDPIEAENPKIQKEEEKND